MKKTVNQSTMVFIMSIIIIAMLIVILSSSIFVYTMSQSLSKAYNDKIMLTENANRFMNGSAYLTNEARAYAANANQKHYDNYWNEVNNLKNRDIGVENMQKIGITAQEQKIIDEMFEISNTLIPLEDSAMKSVKSGDTRSAINYVYGSEYSDSIEKISTLKTEFLSILEDRTQAQIEKIKFLNLTMQIILFIAIIISIIIQMIISKYTKKHIIKPIIFIKDEMNEIAKGNLSSTFNLEPNTSEIGMLTYSLVSTKNTLKKYISEIS